MKFILPAILVLLCLNTSAQQADSPKLVVGIVVDQMCYEYLYRYYDKYCEGGFKKLMNEGLNCRNTTYNYVPTYTGPGHASIYTGTTPNNHGIVANDWYSRTDGSEVNCVEDSTMVTIGTDSDYGKFAPTRLKTNTITDQLKLTYPEAKVISMSIKNRGAILPGGHLSDGSYWYDFTTGTFITSSFYRDVLPKWVATFNAQDQVGEYMKGEWNTLLEIGAYGESGPDNSPYEHNLTDSVKAPVFPYDLSEMTSDSLIPKLFAYTPFCNTYLTDFAIGALEYEMLGEDLQTDMLCISYSTPDLVGHAFGPYSVEIEDIYIRLDLEIKKLIKKIEEKVGDKYVMFLTADHAVVPVPQYLMDSNLPGGYFFIDEHLKELSNVLSEKYGAELIEYHDNLNIYLNQNHIDSLSLDKKSVSRFIANYILDWDEVKRSFTQDDLYSGNSDDDWLKMVRNGFHKEESGDVLYILESGYLPKSEDSDKSRKGTSHGSAYSYDTHVPLLWLGKNIPCMETFASVSITDISATLTHLLYLQYPSGLTGKPILELLAR